MRLLYVVSICISCCLCQEFWFSGIKVHFVLLRSGYREVTPGGRVNPGKIGHAKVCLGPLLGLAFPEEGYLLSLILLKICLRARKFISLPLGHKIE